MRSPSTDEFEEFRVRPGEAAYVDGAVEVTGYTLGCKEIDPKLPECVAKTSFEPATKSRKSWIKKATVGSEAGRMFNPTSPMFHSRGIRRIWDNIGRNQYEWFSVTETQMEAYLRFLKTENPLHLAHAERDQ